MKIKKIEIDIKNKRYYADVAILVDKPDFIDWVNNLRTKWKIDKNFEDYDDFYKHIWRVDNNPKSWHEFEENVKKVRLAYNRSPNFDEVITYAIALGRIPNGIYNPCYYEQIVDPVDPDDERKYKYAIIITPNTTLEDISPILKDIKIKIKNGLEQKKDKNKMAESVADYSFELGPQYTAPSRKIENIVRDRDWYWLHKKLSYEKILSRSENDGEVITLDGVIKAIKAYKARLQDL